MEIKQQQFKTLIAECLLEQEFIIDIDEQIMLLKEIIVDLKKEYSRQLGID